jgi:chromosomal replication initiator protein
MSPASHFIQLPENRSAYQAVMSLVAAAELPLLFLHGPPGSGKSHLANALVEHFTQLDGSRTAQVMSAAELGRALMQSPQDRLPFSKEAIGCDLLVLEDVQHLPAGAAEEIAHILDRRQRRSRPTLVTSGCGPAELELPSRLAGRLAGGLVVGIQPLSLPSRLELAATLCRQRKLKVEDAVINWLARDPGGARPILGEISRLDVLAKLHPPPLKLSVVTTELPSVESDESPLDRLVALVASKFHVPAKALRGPSRTRNVVWPRQVAMYLARQAGISFPQIGYYFGGRDHTTVMHSCEKVAAAVAEDLALAKQLLEMQSSISV